MASPYSTLSTKGTERLTLEQIKRKRALADAMMSRGFKQTQVGPGGSYTPFAGLADALSSALGTYTGHKQNKALDAREAELAAIEAKKQADYNSAYDQPQPTLAEPELAPGRGPVPIPEPEPVAPEQPIQAQIGPQQPAPPPAMLAGALEKVVGQAPQTTPYNPPMAPQGVTPATQAVADAMSGQMLPSAPISDVNTIPAPVTTPLDMTQGGKGLEPLRPATYAPTGPARSYPGLEDAEANIELTRRLSGQGIHTSEHDALKKNYSPEEMYSWLDNVEKPETGPMMRVPEAQFPIDGRGPMPTGEGTGSQAVQSHIPPIVQDDARFPAMPPPPAEDPTPAIAEALMSQRSAPQAPAPAGPAVAPELVQALMEKSGLAMPGPAAAAPGAAPVARPAAQAPARSSTYEQGNRIFKRAQAVGDQAGMKHGRDLMFPEEKEHVIGDTLVRGGKPIWEGRGKLTSEDLGDKVGFFDKQGNLVRTEPKARAPATPLDIERILAARGILPGSDEYNAAMKLAQDKATSHGAGVKIENYGGPTQGVDAQGNPVFFQPSNKGGAPSIIEGVSPPLKDKPEKVLPTKAMTNIEGAASAAEDTERFANTFKPEYGGHFILKGLSNTLGRTFGDKSGQAQWWQDLEARTNIARHELFGSALTKTEQSAWERTTVTPGMDPGQIKENLERRMVIERRAVAKLAKSYMAQGYNKEGIRELLGSNADYILESPTPSVGKPTAKPAAKATASPKPPTKFPPGSKFQGYSENGNRVYKLPDGTITEE